MIHVDETEPVGDIQQSFPSRDVIIKRGVNAKDIYEMVTEIGRGKFGTVYKCQEKATGLQLAAKFVPIPKREDRRNVEREVELMNALQHTLIIQLYDALEYQKMMCVVLELVEGGELFDRVIDDDFVLTERACAVFLRQVCQAMEFVHRNSIIHLDLKPENIMCLTREGNRIKIIDFGLARKYDPDKKLQVLFGTPEFVAPEVVNFDQITFGTDMWSVGVICYVLLSGLSPFMGSTDIETMANVTIGKYDFDDEAFNDVSKEAMDFIRKLLVKDTCIRLTATQCLEHKWLKRRKGPKLGKLKSKSKLKAGKLPLSPTTGNIPQDCRGTNGSTPDDGQLPLELILLVDDDDTENNNNNNRNLNNINNNNNTEGHTNNHKDKEGNDELTATKDNLKSFIERWEEHPNSPYVFDTDANRISPVCVNGVLPDAAVHPKRLNGGSANSGLSSRGGSPLPCDSLSTEILQTSSPSEPIDPLTIPPKRLPILPSNQPSIIRQRSELFDKPQTKIEKMFERRNSDSEVLVDNRSSIHQVNLAEEIKKLSERLMMLSSINTDLKDMNDNLTCSGITCSESYNNPETEKVSIKKENKTTKPQNPREKPLGKLITTNIYKEPSANPEIMNNNEFANRKEPSITKPVIKEKPEFLRNRTRSTMQEIFNKSLISNDDYTKPSNYHHKRTFTRASSVAHESSSFTENVFGNRLDTFGALSRINRGALFDRLKLLEDMPKLQTKLSHSHNMASEGISIQRKSQITTIDHSSGTTNNLSWANQNSSKRTKFRVSQMSRDVPIGLPDTHQTIFLEESVTATKDCLLNLLDKYDNADGEMESTQNGRQSSKIENRISEQRSMNSLNFFFQRHAVMGNTVKQMQAQIESKRKP